MEETTRIKMKKIDQTSRIFRLNVFSKSKTELLKKLAGFLREQRLPQVVFTPNPEQVVLAQRNPSFLAALERADVLLPDGFGLVWAANILHFLGKHSENGEPTVERIAQR